MKLLDIFIVSVHVVYTQNYVELIALGAAVDTSKFGHFFISICRALADCRPLEYDKYRTYLKILKVLWVPRNKEFVQRKILLYCSIDKLFWIRHSNWIGTLIFDVIVNGFKTLNNTYFQMNQNHQGFEHVFCDGEKEKTTFLLWFGNAYFCQLTAQVI